MLWAALVLWAAVAMGLHHALGTIQAIILGFLTPTAVLFLVLNYKYKTASAGVLYYALAVLCVNLANIYWPTLTKERQEIADEMHRTAEKNCRKTAERLGSEYKLMGHRCYIKGWSPDL